MIARCEGCVIEVEITDIFAAQWYELFGVYQCAQCHRRTRAALDGFFEVQLDRPSQLKVDDLLKAHEEAMALCSTPEIQVRRDEANPNCMIVDWPVAPPGRDPDRHIFGVPVYFDSSLPKERNLDDGSTVDVFAWHVYGAVLVHPDRWEEFYLRVTQPGLWEELQGS